MFKPQHSRSLGFAACLSMLLLSACGGGGGGGNDPPGGGGSTVTPLSTRDSAVRTASLVLGINQTFDPNTVDLLPFADPLFPAKRGPAGRDVREVVAKAAVLSDCEISGKRSDDESNAFRKASLFGNVDVDTDTIKTTYFACKEGFVSDTSDGNATFEGFVETGSGLDAEFDTYSYVVMGKSGDAGQNYRVGYEQLDGNELVIETNQYSAAGLIENGSFTDRVESRLSGVTVNYKQKIGTQAETSLETMLGTVAAPLKLIRDNNGRQSIEGPIVFNSSSTSCVDGAISVSTPSMLNGDATFVDGVLLLSSGSSTARFQFLAGGDVDLTLGGSPAQRISAAEFQAAMDNNGC